MRTLPCLALLCSAMFVFGCGSPTVVDADTYYRLELVQTGGFAGVNDTTTLDTAAKSITFRNRSGVVQHGTLSDADVASLAKLVTAANLPDAGGPYACGECADQFNFAATLSLDGSDYQVQFDGDESSPRALLDLAGGIEKLDQARSFNSFP